MTVLDWVLLAGVGVWVIFAIRGRKRGSCSGNCGQCDRCNCHKNVL